MDESGLGVELRWMTAGEMIDEAVAKLEARYDVLKETPVVFTA